jgi:hypothetical protein
MITREALDAAEAPANRKGEIGEGETPRWNSGEPTLSLFRE